MNATTTYDAWLTPDNRIIWRGVAPKPFTTHMPVKITILESFDDIPAASGVSNEDMQGPGAKTTQTQHI